MANSFKAGDVVQLNSGGPIMTVQGWRGPDDVTCAWFDKTKQCQGVFSAAMLHAYKRPRPITFRL